MAYEQKPPIKTGAVKKGGLRTVFIEKSNDGGITNAQLLSYSRLGYEVKASEFGWNATIPEEKYAAIEKRFQDEGIRRVEGSRHLEPNVKQEGIYDASLEHGRPVRAQDLVDALGGLDEPATT